MTRRAITPPLKLLTGYWLACYEAYKEAAKPLHHDRWLNSSSSATFTSLAIATESNRIINKVRPYRGNDPQTRALSSCTPTVEMKFLTIATILAVIIPALGAPTAMPEADESVDLAKRDVAELLGLVYGCPFRGSLPQSWSGFQDPDCHCFRSISCPWGMIIRGTSIIWFGHT